MSKNRQKYKSEVQPRNVGPSIQHPLARYGDKCTWKIKAGGQSPPELHTVLFSQYKASTLASLGDTDPKRVEKAQNRCSMEGGLRACQEKAMDGLLGHLTMDTAEKEPEDSW